MSTFLRTYPEGAIPFENSKGKLPQVLLPIRSASRVYRPQTQTPDPKRLKVEAHALGSSGNPTFTFEAHDAHKVGPAQPPPRSATSQNPHPTPPPSETAREDEASAADEEDLARRDQLYSSAEKHAQTIETTKARLKELEAEKIPPRRDYGRPSHKEEIRNLKASLEFLQKRSKPRT